MIQIGLQERHQRGSGVHQPCCQSQSLRADRFLYIVNPRRRHASCELARTYTGRLLSLAIVLTGVIYVSSMALMSVPLVELPCTSPEKLPRANDPPLWPLTQDPTLAAERRAASSGPRLALWEACLPKCRYVLTILSETPSATLTVGVH